MARMTRFNRYPVMLQKTNVVRGFLEDFTENYCVEKEGVKGFSREEKKRDPQKRRTKPECI